jgi:hypothetical protein
MKVPHKTSHKYSRSSQMPGLRHPTQQARTRRGEYRSSAIVVRKQGGTKASVSL